MYLLDTNVVSELRKPKADAQVKRWAKAQASSGLYLSVITLLELETGVKRIERRDAPQGAVLRQWLDAQVLPAFGDRILIIDAAVARCAAGLHVPDGLPQGDLMIAATALVHGMTVVTRNTADFERTGVPLLNPWLG